MGKENVFYCCLSVYKTVCIAVDPTASGCFECALISDIALRDNVRILTAIFAAARNIS